MWVGAPHRGHDVLQKFHRRAGAHAVQTRVPRVPIATRVVATITPDCAYQDRLMVPACESATVTCPSRPAL